jgi:hypothetical protein
LLHSTNKREKKDKRKTKKCQLVKENEKRKVLLFACASCLAWRNSNKRFYGGRVTVDVIGVVVVKLKK